MHWTYTTFAPGDDLEQGDIIAPTPELRSVLAKYHPYFDNDKYMGFMVATQSCDLVRRKQDAPKALYISMAAVRSLRRVMPDLLSSVATSVSPGTFLSSTREAARQFLVRLFDQNEQALGLFYLHPDASVELGEAAVAFLRVKVALQAEHYPLLVAARRGRLHSEFRAKFGWLLGNLYARAANPDWSDKAEDTLELSKLIKLYLEEQDPGRGPKWVDDVLVTRAKTEKVVLEGKPPSEVCAELEKLRPKPSKDQLAEMAAHILAGLLRASPEHSGPSTKVAVDSNASAAVAPAPSVLLTEAEINDFASRFGKRLAGRATKLLK